MEESVFLEISPFSTVFCLPLEKSCGSRIIKIPYRELLSTCDQ